ncbi:MAG: glycosyltransferase [Acidimicrobiales bacterium]|nr:glycosyltransferase [Acidimicrobiales bacterium]
MSSPYQNFRIRRRTINSAWILLKSGDLTGFSRRLWARLLRIWRTLSGHNGTINYEEWRNQWVDLTARDRDLVASWDSETHFAVVLNHGSPDATDATLTSLGAQLHHNWAIGTESGDADWTVELEPGVVLHPAALATTAQVIDADPRLRMVYADFDHLKSNGIPFDPCFLPDWNPDLFDGLRRIGPLVVRHRSIPISLDGSTSSLLSSEVAHLPYVLASRPSHLRSRDPAPLHKRWPVGNPPPRVSVLIPTKDQGRLLERCLASLREVTAYPNMEIVLVDHESTEQRARAVIDSLSDDVDTLVISFSGPFNFAEMCNRAAKVATGDVLVLLNNDTEVLAPDWLDEFVGQLARPEVGVVGALLLFTNGTIQHAGVHPGVNGLMGHGHKHRPGNDPGYHGRLTVAHEVAAVTGACLGITKTLWNRLGGLDSENLTVAYNDIDLCLRVREIGLRVVMTPHAVLYHHESASRGYDDDPVRRARLQGEVDRMQERWGDRMEDDPAYSPNLSLTESSFTTANSPRTAPPWRTM